MFKNLKFDNDEKKKFIILLSLGLICILSLIVINLFQSKEKENLEDTTQNINIDEEASIVEKNDDLEKRLTSILKEINGAGDVSVMITYDNSEEIEPAYNSNSTKETTSETDSSGGERTVETFSENKTMVTSDSSNPVIIKTKEAKIKGVLVVSSGASNPQVKETLYEAVQTALQISGHQVQIYAK